MLKTDERTESIEIPYNATSVGTTTEDSTIEHQTQTVQRYWCKLKKITAIWMIAWLFPAILLHIPITLTSSIKVNGIPLHWFNAALLSILIGVVLIFIYAFIMDKMDKIIIGER